MRIAHVGRVASKRRMGKLVFYDIKADGEKVQAMAAADNSPLDEAAFVMLHNRRGPCLAACDRPQVLVPEREGASMSVPLVADSFVFLWYRKTQCIGRVSGPRCM